MTKCLEPKLLIQRIVTVWTKKSRGAPGAGSRNAVPDVVVLPLKQFSRKRFGLLEHNVTFHENSEFENPREQTSIFESLGQQDYKRYGCVNVYKEMDVLRINWNYDALDAGLPDRTRSKGTCSLGLNRWGRVVYNGRYSLDWEGGWWYEKKVINIGLFDAPTDTVFSNSNPEVILDRTAILY